MTVRITAQSKEEFKAWESDVRAACHMVLNQLGVDDALMTVVLTDREAVHALNLEFAQDDRATDVLSFPAHEQDPDTGLQYLGDVIIAVPIAEAQALSKGHALRDELALLTIHGTLHLMGYDHAEEVSRNEMWSLQEAALRALGITLEVPRDSNDTT